MVLLVQVADISHIFEYVTILIHSLLFTSMIKQMSEPFDWVGPDYQVDGPPPTYTHPQLHANHQRTLELGLKSFPKYRQ